MNRRIVDRGLNVALAQMVDDALTVPAVSTQYPRFDDMPAVFATAFMVGLAECAAMDALHPSLEQGESSVGIDVRFDHTAATPVGLSVTADAEVTVSGDDADAVAAIAALIEQDLDAD